MSTIPVVGFNNIAKIAISHFTSGRQKKRAIMVLGAPGGGKTALGFHVAEACGVLPHEIGLTRPSFHTPVDYVGVPSTDGGLTRFCPPDFIHKLTTGEIKFWIIDEFPDAVQSVQNVLCGAVYDYDVAGLELHPDLCIFMTGNRVEDRSGAGRVITKAQNRVYQYELARSVDDFCAHAIDKGWCPDMTGYIHWRGESALYGEEGFDPNSPINASPRQWEEVGMVDKSLPPHLYLDAIKGLIPQGQAEDYMGFRRTIAELPPINDILTNPQSAPVSDKIDVCYAVTSRLVTEVTDVTRFQLLMGYMTRLRVEMQTLFVNSARKRVKDIRMTPEYVKWATTNQAYYGADE